MKVVILCGGQGTRLRDITELLPKPMVPIGGAPILWHLMKIYAHFGMKDFILCLGYKGWKIKEYFLNYKEIHHDFTITLGHDNSIQLHNDVEEAEWKITLAETGEESMTGARLWKVRKYLEGEDKFCFTYGDGVADINLKQLITFHDSQGKVGTISGVRPAGRFGELIVDDMIITRFSEKPRNAEGWINGGFMVFDNKTVWDYLWPEDSLMLEKESLPAMVKDRQLAIYKHEGFWVGMDTPREYDLLNQLWTKGNAPWKVWG